jgi:hypothetical protein
VQAYDQRGLVAAVPVSAHRAHSSLRLSGVWWNDAVLQSVRYGCGPT